jgi:hypothetical protein
MSRNQRIIDAVSISCEEVEWEFCCPMKWDDLEKPAKEAGSFEESLKQLGGDEVRHCGHCHKSVYWCRSPKELADHARQGHCVAIYADPDGEFLDTKELLIQPYTTTLGLPAKKR